jgi:hypothetical protein
MSDAIDAPDEAEHELIEIERCELCGCAIEDLEELIYLRAADLIAIWECADPRDAWRHTGARPPKASRPQAERPRPYETPEATQQAFWYCVRTYDDA